MVENILESLSSFDLIYLIISLISIFQCFRKGFVRSLLSASKWLLALGITIYTVPKIEPWANNYIDSSNLLDISLGIGIFILTIFIVLLVSRTISKVVNYSGLGFLDSFFGIIFGVFKGYVVSVILFSIVNWFYAYEKWPIKAEKSFTFSSVYKGSKFLIEKFPDEKNYKDTKEQIEKI
jgi:membrane protein required for colicin V production|tara:strand:+ start:20821 stop:21357 length:537 start_codon:yes stop_codon:yes gene_type:complete